MSAGVVQDDEILFRNVSFQHYQCTRDGEGRWRLSSQAFSDRYYRPSVDRAVLCGGDPRYTQKSLNDGVVSVVTSDVRAISVPQNDNKGNFIRAHLADVLADPIAGNLAHAVIATTPESQNKGVFRRLLEHLRHLAELRGWMIEPKE